MPISFIFSPETVTLDQAPIEVSLTSNLPVERNFQNYLKIAFTGDGPSVGEQFTVAYADVTFTITVQTASSFDGKTISTKKVSQSLDDYKDQVIKELQTNYHIVSDFNVFTPTQSIQGIVRLSPRNDNYILQLDSNLNNTTVSQVLAPNNAFQENPTAVLIVKKYNLNTQLFDTQLIHRQPILETQTPVVFDIRKDFNLRYHLPSAASIRSEEAEKTTDNWQKYQLSYTEQGGLPPTIGGITKLNNVFYVLHGQQEYFNQYQNFWLYFRDSGRFLTAQEQRKMVTMEQPEWLYWIAREDGEYRIQTVVTYRDGTEETFLQYVSVDLLTGEVAYFSVGFEQLGFECYDDNPIVEYAVQVLLDGFPTSTRHVYELTTDVTLHERYYLFGNPLGGMDTIRCSGRRTDNESITTQSATRIVNREVLQDRRGEDLTYDRRSRRSFTQLTGHISKAEIDNLLKLLRIGECWEIDMERGELMPLLIEAGSIEKYKDENDLEGVTWTASYAFEE